MIPCPAPGSCDRWLTTGERCPETLDLVSDAVLEMCGGETVPARAHRRDGCPRQVAVTYRIPRTEVPA